VANGKAPAGTPVAGLYRRKHYDMFTTRNYPFVIALSVAVRMDDGRERLLSLERG